ncbi:hypothetical protein C5167_008516 [Papaver somniferum]|uniref:Uncharacterized protein n=1 Tax=Papaver somniferum TaxID=3469 RepID=A0A4Y7JYN9_PAPSO|nr:hypothetical protein C5167_008516 [Papaver somniferum]
MCLSEIADFKVQLQPSRLKYGFKNSIHVQPIELLKQSPNEIAVRPKLYSKTHSIVSKEYSFLYLEFENSLISSDNPRSRFVYLLKQILNVLPTEEGKFAGRKQAYGIQGTSMIRVC